MAVLIDPPNAAGHGRLWSHLASDSSYDELHAFARTVGIPERGFDRDHYDVPSEYYDDAVTAGVELVRDPGDELVDLVSRTPRVRGHLRDREAVAAGHSPSIGEARNERGPPGAGLVGSSVDVGRAGRASLEPASPCLSA